MSFIITFQNWFLLVKFFLFYYVDFIVCLTSSFVLKLFLKIPARLSGLKVSYEKKSARFAGISVETAEISFCRASPFTRANFSHMNTPLVTSKYILRNNILRFNSFSCKHESRRAARVTESVQ